MMLRKGGSTPGTAHQLSFLAVAETLGFGRDASRQGDGRLTRILMSKTSKPIRIDVLTVRKIQLAQGYAETEGVESLLTEG